MPVKEKLAVMAGTSILPAQLPYWPTCLVSPPALSASKHWLVPTTSTCSCWSFWFSPKNSWVIMQCQSFFHKSAMTCVFLLQQSKYIDAKLWPQSISNFIEIEVLNKKINSWYILIQFCPNITDCQQFMITQTQERFVFIV